MVSRSLASFSCSERSLELELGFRLVEVVEEAPVRVC